MFKCIGNKTNFIAAGSVLFCVTNELSTENGWCISTISTMKNVFKSDGRETPHRKSTEMSKISRTPCLLYYHRGEKQPKGFAFLQDDHKLHLGYSNRYSSHVCSLTPCQMQNKYQTLEKSQWEGLQVFLQKTNFAPLSTMLVWTLTNMNLWHL